MDHFGAAVGRHYVRITAEDETGRRIVPLKYNFRSEMTQDVKAGDQTVDFDLDSE